MPRLEDLSWNQLVEELRELAKHRPSGGEPEDAPEVVLHDLFVHQVELEMQNRELRDAQQQLESSRARYADLYDFAPVGYLTIDASERIQEINLTGAALLGRNRADIIGKPFLAVVPLHDRTTRFHDHVRRCIDGRCRVDDEIELRPGGRPPMLLHMTSAPMLGGDGRAVACRTALVDVTDRRRAERAEADAQMKEQFLGTVSHELRTPLTAITGWASLLEMRERAEGGIDRTTLRHGLEVIVRNASLQSRLIEDLLDVSRILAGKLRVEARPVDVEPLVRAAVDGLRPAAQAKGVTLSAAVAPGTLVFGDAVRLTQVLSNLLNNAVKFTPTGGRVEVETRAEHGRVRLVVRDTGCGIAKDDLPHVFERFKQVDSSTTRTAGGLGLGLAIVEHIVRAHGGDVSASSLGLGHGTTLTVHLPAAHPAKRSDHAFAPRAGDACSLEGCRVLCVDDDVDVLEVMAMQLSERGAVVETARSAAEAMTSLRASTPDVVVSDIGLPVQDGYALVHEIRTMPGDVARVPAIAVTAYAGAASEQRAREAGFQGFLSKPLAPDALVHAVASLAGSSGRGCPPPAGR